MTWLLDPQPTWSIILMAVCHAIVAVSLLSLAALSWAYARGRKLPLPKAVWSAMAVMFAAIAVNSVARVLALIGDDWVVQTISAFLMGVASTACLMVFAQGFGKAVRSGVWIDSAVINRRRGEE